MELISLQSPEVLKDVDHPIVILRAGLYNCEKKSIAFD